MNRPPVDSSGRLLETDATDFERRLLQAAQATGPSRAASARMARALGVSAGVAATTGAVKNHDGSFSVAAASLPVTLTQADAHFKLFDSGSNQGDLPSYDFDSNGDTHLLYGDGSGTAYTL